MIVLNNLSKAHGDRVLFENVNLNIGNTDRRAIIGPNGAGKSTLIRIMQGIEEADTGTVTVPTGTRVGVLEQDVAEWAANMVTPEGLNPSPIDLVLHGALAIQLSEEIEQLSVALTDNPDDETTLNQLGKAQDLFEHIGGYEVRSQAERILAGLGFPNEMMARPLRTLSGGQMMRVALGRLLLSRPDVLLLDEPTNHLDLDSVLWLQDFLRSYNGSVVIVSHDRDFINATSTGIIEVRDGEVTEYAGDFEQYIEARALRLEQQASAAKSQARKIAEIERFVDRFRYKATKARQVQSRVKMLDKIERIEDPNKKRKTMALSFGEPPRAGRTVIELDAIGKSFNDIRVLEYVSLAIERGEKVALVGPNGAGKSTLLKMIVGELTPDEGTRKVGHNVQIAYYTQHQVDGLHFELTATQEVANSVDTSKVNPRSVLGSFLFSSTDADKTIGVMSGGERARVALAKLIANPVNLLCMDEPTNHLDIESRNVLEEALQSYQGAVVLITHDRHLIRSIADVIIHVDNHRATKYLGTYEDWTSRMGLDMHGRPLAKTVNAAPRPAETAKTASSSTDAAPKNSKEARREAAELRKRIDTATKEHRKRFNEVEKLLEKTEAEIAEVQNKLADPETYENVEEVTELSKRHGTLKDQSNELMAEWEQLGEEIEMLEAQALEGN